MGTYRRKVHIEVNPDKPIGYMVTVRDAETGKDIPGIHAIDLHIEPAEVIMAQIQYYELNPENSGVVIKDNEPVSHTETIANPSVDLTAWESIHGLRQMVYEALGQASMCWKGHPQGEFDQQRIARVGENLIADIVQYYRETFPEKKG